MSSCLFYYTNDKASAIMIPGYPERGGWFCLLPNLDIGGGKSLNTLTIISVVVGVAGLVVGVVQLLLMVIQYQKDKNNRQ